MIVYEMEGTRLLSTTPVDIGEEQKPCIVYLQRSGTCWNMWITRLQEYLPLPIAATAPLAIAVEHVRQCLAPRVAL